jgi:hypothetical protein
MKDEQNIESDLLINAGNLIRRITRVKAEIVRHSAVIGFIGVQGDFMFSK